jgi:hypothetical protein
VAERARHERGDAHIGTVASGRAQDETAERELAYIEGLVAHRPEEDFSGENVITIGSTPSI